MEASHANIPRLDPRRETTGNDGRERQREIFRAMTPEQRISAAFRLYWSARRLKEAALRALHPELSEAEIKANVREIFLHVRD